MKKRTDKEDTILKEIESFQIRVNCFALASKTTISPKGGSEKRKTFLMRKNIILFTKKLKQFRELD